MTIMVGGTIPGLAVGLVVEKMIDIKRIGDERVDGHFTSHITSPHISDKFQRTIRNTVLY